MRLVAGKAVLASGLLLASGCLTAAAVGYGTAAASPAVTRTLVPIGSDYQPDTLQMFARAAVEQDASGTVRLLVLPITYSLSATSSGPGERKKNLTLAQTRRQMLEDACNVVRRPDQVCDVELVPALVRADAFLATNLDYFTDDVDGMYVLGGDQTVAMGVVADTPLEQAMAAAYDRGAVFGGNSAGDAIQSLTMVNGFTGDNGPAESLQEGAVDLWTSQGLHDPSRGLVFGLSNAVDEQHVYEQGRLGRAINVALTSGLPVLGMDAATGGPVVDARMLTGVVGFTSAVVVDPVTYRATGTFGGPRRTLSARGVVTHLIPPGGYGYDLGLLRPTVHAAAQPGPSVAGRVYPSVTTPAGAGPLYLAGGLLDDPSGPTAQDFVRTAGGAGARIVVLAVGYARGTDAKADAQTLASALQPSVVAPVRWRVVGAKADEATTASLVRDATGILLTGPDPSSVKAALAAHSTVVDAVRARWAGGAGGAATLLADDAAAAALGPVFVSDPPPGADIDTESSEDFLVSGASVVPGLGWYRGLTVEPRLLPDRQWGQLYHLMWSRPAVPAAGIDVATALRVDHAPPVVVGGSAVVVLDGRQATLGTGTNGAMAARWVMLDTFVDGDVVTP